MKKSIYILFLILMPISFLSHSLVLNIIDNEDNTFLVEAIFNTGESASGALVRVETLASKKILLQKRISDGIELIIDIPNVPYKVVLDGGKGHVVEEIGFPPKNGFEKENRVKSPRKKGKTKPDSELNHPSLAVSVSIILSFILLFSTILISIKNTNMILKEIRNTK